MANNSILLSSLDFDTLKNDFKQFLSSNNSVLKDYNYDGSNISILLDLLAYNTYKNAFMNNMVINESFLDTAQLMDSVVSHSYVNNYIPRSKRAAVATISFSLNTTGINNPLILPKGTIFSGSNANGTYTFVTNNTTSYLSGNNTFYINNLDILEGNYIQDTFIVDYTAPKKQYTLSSNNIDTTSLSVTVYKNNGQSNNIYTMATSLDGLTNNSNVFFIQGGTNGQYMFYFGDGVFGNIPVNGSYVIANYISTNGTDANGVLNFNIDQDIGALNGGYSVPSPALTLSASTGGANNETIESIKFIAPKWNQTRGNCTTAQDYETMLLNKFTDIFQVHAYSGGANSTSINYGDVNISMVNTSGNILTSSRKTDVLSYITPLAGLGKNVKIIDPEIIYIVLNSIIHVNFNNTPSVASVIKTAVVKNIISFNTSNLMSFNNAFRLSKLETIIDSSDIGIESNETSAAIYKIFSPPLNTPYAVTCIFNNQINQGSIKSSVFNSNGNSYTISDNNGILRLSLINSANGAVSLTNIGTVDYINGIITINQILYSNIFAGLKIYATPTNKDIYCIENNILEIDTISGINVKAVNN